MKKFENVLTASKQEAIPFVASGLVVEADGFLLSEDGLANIDAALEISAAAEAENATLNAAVTELQSRLDSANTANASALSDAVAAQAAAEASLAVANASIETMQATIAELEGRTAGSFTSTEKAADAGSTEQVDDMAEFETSYDREAKKYNENFTTVN